jgi:hypothetical protein
MWSIALLCMVTRMMALGRPSRLLWIVRGGRTPTASNVPTAVT